MLLKKYWQVFFAIVLAVDVIALWINFYPLHAVCKPLLMPILLAGLLLHKKDTKEKNWRLIFVALTMSWAGDVFLLFSTNKAIFFVIGLFCFLIAHLAYILYFSRYKTGRGDWYKKHPFQSLAVIIYAIFLYAFLMPFLGSLTIPVAIYTMVISIMILKALGSQPYLPSNTQKLFVFGALFFALSDSLLAINKFYQAYPLLDGIVMASYGLAQALLFAGAVGSTDKTIPVIE